MKRVLIAGLGNEGSVYKNTRHNVGFQVLDFLAKKLELVYTSDRYVSITSFRNKGVHFFLIKPTTYMNLSGNAIRYWLGKSKIEIENLLVITDDIHLPFGTIRLRSRGSDGGHNGFKHINEMVKTISYPRLRFGIGSKFGQGFQSNYVLERWTSGEQEQLPVYLEKCVKVILSFGIDGIQKTMNLYNKKPS